MLFFHGLLTVFLIGIFFYDLTRYLIPNWMTAVILLLWPAMLLLTPTLPEDFILWKALLVALVVFIVGIGIFVMRWAGGGDVKLLAALSLWTGTKCTFEFIAFTSILGGILVLACLLMRPVAARFVKPENAAALPRILRYKEPVPYGVAITVAFLFLLWTGEIPGLPLSPGMM